MRGAAALQRCSASRSTRGSIVIKSWWAAVRRKDLRALAALGAVALVAVAIALVLVLRAPERREGAVLATFEPVPVAATPLAEGTPFRLLTPGPTVPAGHWRWKGQALDPQGKPVAGVCVHIGPGDCHFTSVTTDEEGRWVIDFPQVDVIYEFHFTKDGYRQVDQTVRTTGPGEVDIRMVRP